MPTVFPPWPHLLFGILEPISLYASPRTIKSQWLTIHTNSVAGFLAPVIDLDGFINGQAAHVAAPDTQHPSSVALAYQLGNLYHFIFLLGIGVLHATNEPKVARNYLIACAIADVGHLYATYLGMGWDAYIDVGAWNALTWGNIGATGFLLVNRLFYFAGMFGEPKAVKAAGKEE